MVLNWKEASTIILTTFLKAPVTSQWNYSILTLKRSSKSSFMPNGFVFPGGGTDSGDSCKEWLNVFSKFHINVNDVKLGKAVPPIVSTNKGEISKLLSLKITAIREAFEETGILLCLSKNNSVSDWVSFKHLENLEMWRSKVRKNGSEFLNLCLENDCCPDVNNLHFWSNWLTPTSVGSKRFDTAFFVACSKDLPIAQADKMEAQIVSSLTPKELLKMCYLQEIWLPPPQVYEISRLTNFKDVCELQKFSKDRSNYGSERWMPVKFQTKNGEVYVLPGDEAYKCDDFITLTKPTKVDLTNEEFRSQFKVLHRMESVNGKQTKIVVQNYNPTNGHILPYVNCKKTIFNHSFLHLKKHILNIFFVLLF